MTTTSDASWPSSTTSVLDFLADRGVHVNPIIAAWTQPHRSYHGYDNHLIPALYDAIDVRRFYGLNDDDFFTLVLMIVFHDYVYDVGASDNEERSAEAAVDAAFWQSRVDDLPRLDGIRSAIVGTKNHLRPPSFLAACLYDIDLAGLGRVAYEANRVAVRNEFGISDDNDPAWIGGRLRFLNAYTPGVGRPNLFHTSWGARLELAATRNMSQELILLQRAATEQGLTG